MSLTGCGDWREQVTAWVDGELHDSAEIVALQAHLAACDGCRVYAEAEAATKSLVAEAYRVPVDLGTLRARALERVRVRTARQRRVAFLGRGLWRPRLAWGVLAAGLLVTLVTGALMLRPETAVEASPLVRAAVGEHRVCMMGQVPLDVTTTDQAEVGRWVRARLARPVTLPALVPEGKAKLSARVAHLPPADAAQIFFDRRGRMLSLFIVPAARDPGPLGRPVARASRDFFLSEHEGYTVVSWRRGDILYSLVAAGDPDAALRLAVEYAVAREREGRNAPGTGTQWQGGLACPRPNSWMCPQSSARAAPRPSPAS